MDIGVRKRGIVHILDVNGRLTIGDGDVKLRETFQPLLDDGGRMFIVNLTRCPYLDSSGLGETVACVKRAREREGSVKVVLREGGKPHDCFVITHLDRAVDLFADEQEALASFIGEPVA